MLIFVTQTDLRRSYGNEKDSPMSVRTFKSSRTENSVRSTGRPQGEYFEGKTEKSVNCVFPSSLTIDTEFNISINNFSEKTDNNDFCQNDGFLEISLTQPGLNSSPFLLFLNF